PPTWKQQHQRQPPVNNDDNKQCNMNTKIQPLPEEPKKKKAKKCSERGRVQ
ncbi:12706_t:CDS:1, partial [Gigaspora rosea]